MSFGSRGSLAKSNAPSRLLACPSRCGERREPPVVLDEPQDRGVVEWRAVDHSPPRVGADQQRRYAEAAALRRPDMVEPAAPLVVGPHERRAAPCLATGERVDQRPHQRLTRSHSAGRMLAAARRRDVGDRRQRPAFEVLVVLIQIDDVAEQLPVTHDAREVQERDAYRLGAAVGPSLGGDREARVVVLDVELPRDAALLEPVEDRRQVRRSPPPESGHRDRRPYR